MIHENSRSAYEEIKPELSGRRKEIYLTMLKHGTRLTDREIKDMMGLSDMNAVRPRITEMIKSGHVEEVESVKCPVTNKTVRKVRIKNCPKTGPIWMRATTEQLNLFNNNTTI